MKQNLWRNAALAGLMLALNLSVAAQDAPNPAVLETAKLNSLPLYTTGAGDGDYRLAPPYANAPELTPRPDVPKGKITRFFMESADSKIYPGIAKDRPGEVVPYRRRVTVYVPTQYQAGAPIPFLISQDSMAGGQTPTILDNMIADQRLPVMAAIFIDSGGGDSYGSERGYEYDTVSGRYAKFIETEVLPRAAREANVAFTKDPEARLIMGGSSGGACALSAAWFHPDYYHRVLTYSGTYVAQQSPVNPESLRGAWEYHATFIPKSKRKPLRIWMHVGDHDLRYGDREETWHNWVLANQRTAAALKAKGYHYQFVYAQESGHVDGRVVNQTLPQALEYVWADYKFKGKKAHKTSAMAK